MQAEIPYDQRIGVTISQAVSLTGLSRSKIYMLIGVGAISSKTIGRRRIVEVASLRRLIQQPEPSTSEPGRAA